jgi:hypothetical protein
MLNHKMWIFLIKYGLFLDPYAHASWLAKLKWPNHHIIPETQPLTPTLASGVAREFLLVAQRGPVKVCFSTPKLGGSGGMPPPPQGKI